MMGRFSEVVIGFFLSSDILYDIQKSQRIRANWFWDFKAIQERTPF